ncbi:phosphatase PAP2 family protein [soil metagenome]
MSTSPLIAFAGRAIHLARTEIAALAALMVIAFGALTFADLAEDSREPGSQAFDLAVLHALHPYADAARPLGPPWAAIVAADITSLGSTALLVLFALVAVGLLLMLRKRLSALLLVVGLAGGLALSEGLKAVFERERPPLEYQSVHTLNASFPSGHALLSAVFYLTLGVMLTRAFPRRRLKAYVMGVAILMTLLVGTTRIYLGAHWATDVFAGWSVGAAWAMALWLVSYAVERRQLRHNAALQDKPSPIETSPAETSPAATAAATGG